MNTRVTSRIHSSDSEAHGNKNLSLSRAALVNKPAKTLVVSGQVFQHSLIAPIDLPIMNLGRISKAKERKKSKNMRVKSRGENEDYPSEGSCNAMNISRTCLTIRKTGSCI